MDYNYKIKSMLFGIAIGDAIGVPVEFKSREYLIENPVYGMTGFGTYNKPPGIFSDDSSLTFTLIESLIDGYDLNTIGENMVKWLDEAFWTGDGEVFDVGFTTQIAIDKLKNGISPRLSGEFDEYSNGNGSLMRIAPLVFNLISTDINERFQRINEVSSITHAHIRSVISCFYFLEFLRHLLLSDLEKHEIYHLLQNDILNFLDNYFQENDLKHEISEIAYFDRLLNGKIYELDKIDIKSSGYVIDTLEASIWCLLNTDNYEEAILTAVNLGNDTDTTAAVTGALAGLLYGFDNIPKKWIEKLARFLDIEDLAIRFGNSLE
jgi:ADP-ribosylglycohydrolase